MFFQWFNPRPIVMVICTANVCRSPVAAVLLRDALKKGGNQRLCRVLSAGTNVASPGRRPDPRMDKLMRQRGFSLRSERALQITPRMLEKASLVIAMESKHLERLREFKVAGATEPQMRLLGEWSSNALQRESPDIVDPYFASAAAVATSFDAISDCVGGLADSLLAGELELA